MLSNHRPSILKRPIKQPTLSNVESRETEYQQQQEYWRQKSERAKETEDRLRRSIYPDADSKRIDQAAVKQVMEAQLKEARERRVAEANHESNSWDPSNVTADHPWARKREDPIQAQIADIRRRMAREAAEENRQMIEERRERERLESQLEKQRMRDAVQNEATWWNRGAASDRWLPPEMRVRQGYGMHELHGREAPYKWDEPPQQPRAEQMVRPEGPAQRTNYPWTWEESKSPAALKHKPGEMPEQKVYPWSWDA